MVNWQDPALQLYSGHAAGFSTALSVGAYLWEFAVCLGFDWKYLSGRRSFRWTLVPYFTARYFCALTCLSLIIPSNMFTPTGSCKVWWRAIYATVHIALQSSSFLLVIRAIAIAENNRVVVAGLGATWVAELGTSIYSIALIRGVYIPPLLACGGNNTHVSMPYMLCSLALHVACFTLVLFLLLRSRGAGLWRLLVSQGIIYFTVSMVAHTSSSVLLLLNLNEGMNLVLLAPSVVALVICSTRMYRGLVSYGRAGVDEFMMSASAHFKTSVSEQAAVNARRSIALPRHFNMYSVEDDGGEIQKASSDVMRKTTTLGSSREVYTV